MGVIVRQGFKHSLVNLVAILIGMVNVLFIYTLTLSKTELGLFKYLISVAQLIFPFLLLGLGVASIRFFPDFQEKSKRNNGFLFFLFLIPFISFLIFLGLSIFFKDTIFRTYADHADVDLMYQFLPFVPALIFAMMLAGLLTNYISNFKRIVVPEIFNNLWLKIAIPWLALAYYWGYFTFFVFICLVVGAYFVSTIGLFIYLWWLDGLDFKPNMEYFTKPELKKILNFAAYSLMGGMGTIIATQIDTYMVGTLIDMGNVGVYSIALFIATVIGVPLKSALNISAPIISDFSKQKEFSKIEELYSKTSLNLLIVGVLLLTGIWTSIDLLFEIIPNGEQYKAGKYIVLILGLAKLIDMATSINTYIIVFSDLYKFNLYFSLLLAVLNVVFNLIFIPNFGIIGVALATLSSMFIFNLLKFLLVYYKFKMQPFSWNMLLVLLLGLLSFTVCLFIPKINQPFIDIIINSIVITLIYVPAILFFNLSDDLTKLKQQIIKKAIQFID